MPAGEQTRASRKTTGSGRALDARKQVHTDGPIFPLIVLPTGGAGVCRCRALRAGVEVRAPSAPAGTPSSTTRGRGGPALRAGVMERGWSAPRSLRWSADGATVSDHDPKIRLVLGAWMSPRRLPCFLCTAARHPPLLRQEMKRVPEAIEQFQLALNVNPDFIPAVFHLGVAGRRAGYSGIASRLGAPCLPNSLPPGGIAGHLIRRPNRRPSLRSPNSPYSPPTSVSHFTASCPYFCGF